MRSGGFWRFAPFTTWTSLLESILLSESLLVVHTTNWSRINAPAFLRIHLVKYGEGRRRSPSYTDAIKCRPSMRLKKVLREAVMLKVIPWSQDTDTRCV